MSNTLRSKTIKLGYANPDVRDVIAEALKAAGDEHKFATDEAYQAMVVLKKYLKSDFEHSRYAYPDRGWVNPARVVVTLDTGEPDEVRSLRLDYYRQQISWDLRIKPTGDEFSLEFSCTSTNDYFTAEFKKLAETCYKTTAQVVKKDWSEWSPKVGNPKSSAGVSVVIRGLDEEDLSDLAKTFTNTAKIIGAKVAPSFKSFRK